MKHKITGFMITEPKNKTYKIIGFIFMFLLIYFGGLYHNRIQAWIFKEQIDSQFNELAELTTSIKIYQNDKVLCKKINNKDSIKYFVEIFKQSKSTNYGSRTPIFKSFNIHFNLKTGKKLVYQMYTCEHGLIIIIKIIKENHIYDIKFLNNKITTC